MTGDPIQDLFVRFGADVSGFQAGVQQVTDSAKTFEDRIQELVDSGKTLNQALAAVGDAAKSAAVPVGDAGAAAQQAYGPFVELSRALADFGESAGTKAQADGLAAALKGLGDSAGTAYKPVKDTGDAVSQVVLPANSASLSVNQLGEAFGQMGRQLLSLAGIAITAAGLKDLAEAALEAFGELQKTTIAITLMTGSAHEAEQSIAGLKDLALQDALSFPSLVSANQRFVAFKLGIDGSNDALRVAADFAAATGNSFEGINNKLVTMIGEGVMSSRTLKDLGVDTHDVAAAMGQADLSAQEVSTAFKNMDQAGRLEIFKRLLIEVKDWEGAAGQMAQTVPGQFQQAKNIMTFALQDIGDALSGAGPGFVFLAKIAGTAALAMMTAFKELADGAVDIGLIFVDLGSGIAQWADDMAHGRLVQGAQDVKNIWTGLKSTGAKFTADFAKDQDDFKTAIGKIWADIPEQEKLHLGKIPDIILKTKGDADKAWAAFVAQEYKMALPFGKTPNASSDTQEIAQQYEAAIAAHKKGQQETHKFEAGFPEFMSGGWDLMGEKLDATMQKAEKAAPAMSILFDPVTKSLQMVTARTRDVNDTTGQFIDKMLFLAETSGGTMAAVLKLNDAYKTLGTQSMPEVLKSADDVAKAFGTVTGTVSDTQGVLLADTSQMTNDQQRLWLDTVTKIQGYWKTLGQSIPQETQLAMDQVKTHLEDASMTIDQAFKNLGVTSQSSLHQTAKQAQDSYELIKESGQATTRELLQAWTNMTEKQIAATGDLGRLWVDMTKQMSHGLADAIVDGKNFGDAMITVFKNIAKTILSELIEGALTKLGTSLFGISNQASGLGGILSKIGIFKPSGGGNLSATAGPAYDPEGILAPVTSDASGLGGSASSLLSSLGSIGSIAGAIAGIGSGIVSGIQQAHANNLLDEIEKSTRYTKIMTELSIVPNVEKFLPRINEIRDFFFDWAQPIWFDMHEYLRDTRDHLMGGGSILAGTSAVGVFNAPGDTGIRLSPDSIAALAAAIAAASGSSGDGGGVAGAVPSPAVIDKLNNAVFRRFKQQGLAPTKA